MDLHDAPLPATRQQKDDALSQLPITKEDSKSIDYTFPIRVVVFSLNFDEKLYIEITDLIKNYDDNEFNFISQVISAVFYHYVKTRTKCSSTDTSQDLTNRSDTWFASMLQ